MGQSYFLDSFCLLFSPTTRSAADKEPGAVLLLPPRSAADKEPGAVLLLSPRSIGSASGSGFVDEGKCNLIG